MEKEEYLKKRLFVVSYLFFDEWRSRVNMIYESPSLYVNSEADVLFVSDSSFYAEDGDPFSYGEPFSEERFSLKTASSILDSIRKIDSRRYGETVFFFPDAPWHKEYADAIATRLFGKGAEYFLIPSERLFFEEERFRKTVWSKGVRKTAGETGRSFFFRSYLATETRNFFMSRSTMRETVYPERILCERYLAREKSDAIYWKLSPGGWKEYCYACEDPASIDALWIYLDDMDRDDFEYAYPFVPESMEWNGKLLCVPDAKGEGNLAPSAPKLCETFRDFGLFGSSELMKALLYAYERSDVDENGEIALYRRIGIDPEGFRKVYLETLEGYPEERDAAKLREYMESSYKSPVGPIYKCAECLEGKVYPGYGSFYCDSCDFRIVKALVRKRYGIEMTKRDMRALLKRGVVVMGKGERAGKFAIRKSGKWWMPVPLSSISKRKEKL